MRRSTHFPQFGSPEPPAATFQPLGPAQVVGRTASSVRLRSATATVEVTALAPDLFRVGMFEDGWPVEYRSEAVARTDWPAHEVDVASDGTRIETGELALYEDAGEGFGYQQDQFSRVAASCRVDAGRVVVDLTLPEGSYVAERSRVELDVRGVAEPSAVLVDGLASTSWRYEPSRLVVELTAARTARRIEIQTTLT